MSCFGCINNGSQGSDYSDCWKCNLENHSFYEEDEEFTEIKKQIREDAIDEIEKLLLDRFTCDDLRTDWTNADIRETIHFELKQLKEDKNG